MQWYYLITTLVLFYSSVHLWVAAYKKNHIMHTALAAATLFWTFGIGLRAFGPMLEATWSDSTVELLYAWADIVAVALVLCFLALLIRTSKPVFARFPLAFTALPLLIIATFPLVQHTVILKGWMIGLYEGGALLIALLVYGVKTSREERYTLLTAGLLVFLGCFLAVWLVPKSATIYDMLWKGMLLLGIGVTFSGYRYSEEYGENRQRAGGEF